MRRTSHYIEGVINNAKSKLVLMSPYLKLAKTFYERWLKSELNHLADSDRKQYVMQCRDKEIAKLEQEYQDLMEVWPRDVARLAKIISALGRLWNEKLRDEQNEALIGRDGMQDIKQLQKAVSRIVSEGKEEMAKAQSKEEIHKAFIEGLDKVRCLMGE